MSLVEANWNPTPRQLRQFSLISLLALPTICWFWGLGSTTVLGALGVGLLIAAAGWFVPSLVRPLFLGLMIVAIPIGLVVGEVSLLAIYFTVFLPIGILFRIMGRDRMDRSIDRERSSYWEDKELPQSVASYYRQS